MLKLLVFFIFLSSSLSYASGSDFWSKNKAMNMPSGVATTACSFYNSLDQSSEKTVFANEIYKRWLRGWVSAFAMYSDWEVRDIEDNEYLQFIQIYCAKHPNNTIGMAAHAFTYRVKK